MGVMNELESDMDRVKALCNVLIERATGGSNDDGAYSQLRQYVLSKPSLKERSPKWLASTRSLDQFWNYIKYEYSSYAERRDYLWAEFEPLFSYCESGASPATTHVQEGLESLASDHIHAAWDRALERIETDPEGAITLSRSLLESACKIILDKQNVDYSKSEDTNSLYKKVAGRLNLSPGAHDEKVFKQILTGCNGIVGGLGQLRNALSDAHGKGVTHIKPAARHARLAVNVAGAMAAFLAETHRKWQG